MPDFRHMVNESGPSAQAAEQIHQFLGYDPRQVGYLTREAVRESSLAAKATKSQVKWAKRWKTNLFKIFDDWLTLQQIRKEVTEKGLETLEGGVQLAADANKRAVASHEKVQTIGHATQLAIGQIQHRGGLERQSLSDKVTAQLLQAEMTVGHRTRLAIGAIGESTAEQIQEMDRQQILSRERRQFEIAEDAYLRGDPIPMAGAPQPGQQQRRSAWWERLAS